ncbi:nucleotidyltransferase domain-containing protein [Candidatus Synechococcus calcipolaris G9]|uniref:Nucleotidyltransferase domain-containing protein n=1 Tax=Candidatus Synechococcus calcipolaris G9 TaxID=1497997 RepID=A0ABT6EV03_9SYNE|nr:nucleotidyltransferase domain-containing protein [Candidatus Synechococcus calcipolaris]MDG2989650.1 nucleotidyltransferase domain-containing protein [Candidatus Synechococcus calcipolaris G9]
MSDAVLTQEHLQAVLKQFLQERGEQFALAALGYFGSYARNEAHPDSDVDIVYQPLPSARLTLFDVVLLREELMERLGRPVDLIHFRERMPAGLRERVRQEAVYV